MNLEDKIFRENGNPEAVRRLMNEFLEMLVDFQSESNDEDLNIAEGLMILASMTLQNMVIDDDKGKSVEPKKVEVLRPLTDELGHFADGGGEHEGILPLHRDYIQSIFNLREVNFVVELNGYEYQELLRLYNLYKFNEDENIYEPLDY